MASDAVPPGTRKTIAEMRKHPGLKSTKRCDVCHSSDPRARAQRISKRSLVAIPKHIRTTHILRLERVSNGCFERFLIKQVSHASFARPPFLANVVVVNATRLFVILELAFAPRLQLISYFFAVMTIRGNDGVAVIGTAIHRMKMPSSDLRMQCDRVVDDDPLVFVQK
jgi:hypothetical protein